MLAGEFLGIEGSGDEESLLRHEIHRVALVGFVAFAEFIDDDPEPGPERRLGMSLDDLRYGRVVEKTVEPRG